MQGNQLAQLKDIHMPPAVSFWPLAPGWYVVLALIIAASVALLFYLYKCWKKQQRTKSILHQVIELQTNYQHGNKQQALAQLSVLLRRAALAKYPRNTIAGLYGDAWLEFLNTHCPNNLKSQKPFSQPEGKILLNAPYQQKIDIDADKTFELVKHWIKHNV